MNDALHGGGGGVAPRAGALLSGARVQTQPAPRGPPGPALFSWRGSAARGGPVVSRPRGRCARSKRALGERESGFCRSPDLQPSAERLRARGRRGRDPSARLPRPTPVPLFADCTGKKVHAVADVPRLLPLRQAAEGRVLHRHGRAHPAARLDRRPARRPDVADADARERAARQRQDARLPGDQSPVERAPVPAVGHVRAARARGLRAHPGGRPHPAQAHPEPRERGGARRVLLPLHEPGAAA